MSGYHTYRTLAERDQIQSASRRCMHMAQAEAQHAALWAETHSRTGRQAAEISRQNQPATPTVSPIAWAASAWRSRRLEIDESRAIAQVRPAIEGAGRRAKPRHSAPGNRRGARTLPGVEQPHPPALSAPAPFEEHHSKPKGPARRTARPAQRLRAGSRPRAGSATPSTASTTDWARSSASSPASPAQPWATANTCCSQASPA